jgi:hypothetical protein
MFDAADVRPMQAGKISKRVLAQSQFCPPTLYLHAELSDERWIFHMQNLVGWLLISRQTMSHNGGYYPRLSDFVSPAVRKKIKKPGPVQ